MKNTTVWLFLCALAAGAIGFANSARAATIFSDDFETGTANTNIAAPWGKNDITPSTYQTASNPFPTGLVYGDLTDPGPGTNPSQAVRLLSRPDGATGSGLAGVVTSFSFNFYEPTVVGDVNSVVTGYYREQANVDLNSAGRNYTVTLNDGVLAPQTPVGAPANGSYPINQVNTLFIIANDSAVVSPSYGSPSRTVAPLTADVWLALGNAAPVYVFSVNRQNQPIPAPAPNNNTPVLGVGFRTNNADVERLLIDNVLVVTDATLDRTAVPEPASLVLLMTLSTAVLGMARRGRRATR
jgi:hypothetical protein